MEMIDTERLILRQWRPEDHAVYAANMADLDVAYWLGGTQTEAAALATVRRLAAAIDRDGYGRFAIERREDGRVIGAAGICPIPGGDELSPGQEIGWHLSREAWGRGYVSEAARAVLTDGFQRCGFNEILSYTAQSNSRSRAVMERIGMARDASRDFDHPSLALDHPLLRHVVYFARPEG